MENSEQMPEIPNGKEAVEVAVAAERLRLPTSSVERALERGFIEGIQRQDGTWLVLLDKQDGFSRLTDAPVEETAPRDAANVNQQDREEPTPVEPQPSQADVSLEDVGLSERDVEPIP